MPDGGPASRTRGLGMKGVRPLERSPDSITVVNDITSSSKSGVRFPSFITRIYEAKNRVLARVRKLSVSRHTNKDGGAVIVEINLNAEEKPLPPNEGLPLKTTFKRLSSIFSKRRSSNESSKCPQPLDEILSHLRDDEYVLQTGESKNLVHQIPPWSRHSSFWWELQEASQRVIVVRDPWFHGWREYNRPIPNVVIWHIAKIAEAGVLSEEALKKSMFKPSTSGPRFTLTPTPRSTIPLQWFHVGTKAIPDFHADMTFQATDVLPLLDALNLVFGTNYELTIPGLCECLSYVLDVTRDFGEAYGFLRRWWLSHVTSFVDIPAAIEDRRKQDLELRRYTISENCISPSRIPPRRVWDLCSNRVLPVYALDPKLYCDDSQGGSYLNMSVCRVSHSWVDEQERQSAWTKINGEQWPVPIPRNTSLEHIRVEMLNIGAEYVWLDVLCLRQKLEESDARFQRSEEKRKEEWKLDIPTIGSIFDNPDAYIITYFNGLGLPLDTSSKLCDSPRHWFNRVWTLQETSERWVLGGVTGAPLTDGDAFFQRLRGILVEVQVIKAKSDFPHIAPLLPLLAGRHCATEVDRISGLAYLLGCDTLPVYDETISVQDAWALLIKHLPPPVLGELFFRSRVSDTELPLDLWPSWHELQEYPPDAFQGGPPAKFWLSNYSHLATREPGTDLTYLSLPRLASNSYDITVVGPCSIQHTHEDDAAYVHLTVGERAPFSVECSALQHTCSPDSSYTLIGYPEWQLIPSEEVYPRYWVVTEVVSDKVTEDGRSMAVVRWGLLIMDSSEAKRFAQTLELKPGKHNISVRYLSGKRARNHSMMARQTRVARTQ